jgi:ActR/RegA family two-component response regulator
VRSGENVLIVEDEDEWSGYYERAVRSLDDSYRVKVARDLVSAERLIDATKFAVAFVDIGLDINDDRNVDGLRVMERIRTADDDTSIIVVTGRSGQDTLSIARDALKEYSAYDTVGKSSVEPTDIRKLFKGGLEEYRKASAAGRRGAHEALRGGDDPMAWDSRLMRTMNFKGNASDFYEFLNRLLGRYLPIVARTGRGQLSADSSTGLFYGEYWSRAIGSAVIICFGSAEQFEQAMEAGRASGMLLGQYDVGNALDEQAGHGAGGAVFALVKGRREDFGEKPVG